MMSCSNFNQELGIAIDDSGRLQEVPRAVPIQMSAVGETLNRNNSKTPILPNPFSQREPHLQRQSRFSPAIQRT
jgi:hypothetical protein